MNTVVLAGLAAIVVLALLVAVIATCVVRKARAEDLPQLLTALSHVVEAAARFLPWGGSEGDSVTLVFPVPEESSRVPESRTVPGTIVAVNSSAGIPDTLTARPSQPIPPASGSSGGAQ